MYRTEKQKVPTHAFFKKHPKTCIPTIEMFENQAFLAGNCRSREYSLGFMYPKGDGVPEDYVQTYTWFNLAAAQGNEGAQRIKPKVAKRMTPSQIAKAQRLSKIFAQNIKLNLLLHSKFNRPVFSIALNRLALPVP
ncbi:MAG: hypothetical protein ACI9UN_004414 [Granulosicoccus sp.]|jgi:hypothetical protein